MRESEQARNDRGSAKSQRPLAHGSKASAPTGDDRAGKGVPGGEAPGPHDIAEQCIIALFSLAVVGIWCYPRKEAGPAAREAAEPRPKPPVEGRALPQSRENGPPHPTSAHWPQTGPLTAR